MSDQAIETVEVSEPAVAAAPVVDRPTRDQVIKERGWTAQEADTAEKNGMLAKPEEKKEPVKVEPLKAEVKEEPKKEDRRRPLADHEFDMTPEQEAKFHEIFPAGTKPSSFFTGLRIERIKRQEAARQVEQLRRENDAFKAKLEAFEKFGGAKPQPVVDEHGNEIDPNDKPLTRKDILEMNRELTEERERQQKEIDHRSRASAQAHQEQEAFAREVYPDFDDALSLAGDLAKNLETVIQDPSEQKFVRRLMVEFQNAVANADKIGAEDLNAAELAYRLGRLHPNYGKPQTVKTDIEPTTGITPEKNGNGGLTPEQLKRLEQNTQRRASSASIPGGGGKKAVTADEVTLQQLNRMNSEQRTRFREKYPDHYSKLLRG